MYNRDITSKDKNQFQDKYQGKYQDPEDTRVIVRFIFGLVCTFCMVFGTPANILSFLYFIKRKTVAATNKAYMTYLYRMITFIDVLICFLVFPLIEAAFRDFHQLREPDSKMKQAIFDDAIFDDATFCTIWGVLWNILPVLSVFLVAILSCSRCLILLYPLKKLHIKKPAIFLAVLTSLILTEKLVAHFASTPLVYDDVRYRYDRKVKVCYILATTDKSAYILTQSIVFTILLGLPVVPILGSFIVSVHKLRAAQKKESRVKSTSNEQSKHREATITVIIITGIYILCNIPVLCFYLYVWSHDKGYFFQKKDKDVQMRDRGARDNRPDEKYHYMIISLLWITCYTLLVAINSSFNPIIYYTRMKEFRDAMVKWKKITKKFLVTRGEKRSRTSEV